MRHRGLALSDDLRRNRVINSGQRWNMARYFTVRGNPNLEGLSFPSFEQACAAWYRDGRFGAVLNVDLKGRIVERFKREECDEAAKLFLNPEIARRNYRDW